MEKREGGVCKVDCKGRDKDEAGVSDLEVLKLLANGLDLVGHIELVGVGVAAVLAHLLDSLEAELAVLL